MQVEIEALQGGLFGAHIPDSGAGSERLDIYLPAVPGVGSWDLLSAAIA